MHSRLAKIIVYACLMLLFLSLAIISLLLLPLLIFGLFALASIATSIFFIRALLIKPQTPPQIDKGMRRTDDELLFKTLDEIQKKGKGKHIGQK